MVCFKTVFIRAECSLFVSYSQFECVYLTKLLNKFDSGILFVSSFFFLHSPWIKKGLKVIRVL